MSMRIRRTALKPTAALLTSAAAALGLLGLGTTPAAAATGGQIVNIANANLGKGYCSTNSAGGTGFNSSCSGNSGTGEYWCGDYVAWVWHQAGVPVPATNPAYVPSWMSTSAYHSLSSGYVPKPGDAVIFGDDNYPTQGSHISIVTNYSNGLLSDIGGDEGGGGSPWWSTSSVKVDEGNGAAWNPSNKLFAGQSYEMWVLGYVSSGASQSSNPSPSAPSLGDQGSIVSADGTQYTFTRDASNGHLQATYLPKGGSWATADMTSMVGTPASAGGAPATFIQQNGTIGITTADASNGHLQMTYLPQGGQWSTVDLTTMVGTPVTGGGISNVIAPDGTLYIFSRGSTNGGRLSVTYLGGSGWATADITGMVGTPASAGGAPAAFVQNDGTIGVVTANSANGHVFMTYLPNGGQWTGADLTTIAGTPVTDGNFTNVNAPDGTHYIFSHGSTNGGHLSATYLGGSGWATADMTTMVGTPASAGGAPSGFVQNDGTIGVVTANSANGHVYMTYLPNGGQWTGADLTTIAGTPVTGGSVNNVIAPDGTHYIFTVGSTNGGHLSATYAGSNWATADMTSMVGTPTAG